MFTPPGIRKSDIVAEADWAAIDMEEEENGEVQWAREKAEAERKIFVDTREKEQVNCKCGYEINPFELVENPLPPERLNVEEAKVIMENRI